MQRRFCCTLSVIEEKMKIFRDLDFRRSRKIFITISSIQRFIFSYVFSGSKHREREREREREGRLVTSELLMEQLATKVRKVKVKANAAATRVWTGTPALRCIFFSPFGKCWWWSYSSAFSRIFYFYKNTLFGNFQEWYRKNNILQNCPCSVGKRIKSCPEFITVLCWFFWNFIF